MTTYVHGIGDVDVDTMQLVKDDYSGAFPGAKIRIDLTDEQRATVSDWVAQKSRERAAKIECVSKGRRAFVRFGPVPESGRSFNHLDNRLEAGVSVYAAWITPHKVWIDATDETGVGYIVFGDAEGRKLYEVSGALLDERGGDDEPLLANATTVGLAPQAYEVIR